MVSVWGTDVHIRKLSPHLTPSQPYWPKSSRKEKTHLAILHTFTFICMHSGTYWAECSAFPVLKLHSTSERLVWRWLVKRADWLVTLVCQLLIKRTLPCHRTILFPPFVTEISLDKEEQLVMSLPLPRNSVKANENPFLQDFLGHEQSLWHCPTWHHPCR